MRYDYRLVNKEDDSIVYVDGKDQSDYSDTYEGAVELGEETKSWFIERDSMTPNDVVVEVY